MITTTIVNLWDFPECSGFFECDHKSICDQLLYAREFRQIHNISCKAQPLKVKSGAFLYLYYHCQQMSSAEPNQQWIDVLISFMCESWYRSYSRPPAGSIMMYNTTKYSLQPFFHVIPEKITQRLLGNPRRLYIAEVRTWFVRSSV